MEIIVEVIYYGSALRINLLRSEGSQISYGEKLSKNVVSCELSLSLIQTRRGSHLERESLEYEWYHKIFPPLDKGSDFVSLYQ